MSTGAGQVTGNLWGLHAYAHRKTSRCPAYWSVHYHSSKLTDGFADTLAQARAAALQVITTLTEAADLTKGRPSETVRPTF